MGEFLFFGLSTKFLPLCQVRKPVHHLSTTPIRWQKTARYRQAHKLKVAGSNPAPATIVIYTSTLWFGGVSWADFMLTHINVLVVLGVDVIASLRLPWQRILLIKFLGQSLQLLKMLDISPIQKIQMNLIMQCWTLCWVCRMDNLQFKGMSLGYNQQKISIHIFYFVSLTRVTSIEYP